MYPPLALHHFTIADASPRELIETAATLDCGAVCLFVHEPPGTGFQLVTHESADHIGSLLKHTGVRVTNVEFFQLTAGVDLETFRAPLAVGAQLGARLAVTHIHDTNFERALDKIGRFADLAGEYDLVLGLEFMGLTPGCTNLARARRFVESINRDCVGLAVDALHLSLTGGTPDALTDVAPRHIAYAQLCDGVMPAPDAIPLDTQDYAQQAFARPVPGRGNLPLARLVSVLGRDTWYDVECPAPQAAAQGVSPLERARRALEAARELLTTIQTRR